MAAACPGPGGKASRTGRVCGGVLGDEDTRPSHARDGVQRGGEGTVLAIGGSASQVSLLV